MEKAVQFNNKTTMLIALNQATFSIIQLKINNYNKNFMLHRLQLPFFKNLIYDWKNLRDYFLKKYYNICRRFDLGKAFKSILLADIVEYLPHENAGNV